MIREYRTFDRDKNLFKAAKQSRDLNLYMEGNKMEGNKPVVKLRKGMVTLTGWENKLVKEGNAFSVISYNLEKNYKEGDEWKKTYSFKEKDLMDALVLINELLRNNVKSE